MKVIYRDKFNCGSSRSLSKSAFVSQITAYVVKQNHGGRFIQLGANRNPPCRYPVGRKQNTWG